MSRWPHEALTDDFRPLLLDAQRAKHPFAIATLVETSGPAPRDIGAQMLITPTAHWGYLSGGCIEADVARHAREAMAEQRPRLLRYGEGSPWIDIRLACGTGISVLVEPVTPDDPACARLLAGHADRVPILWTSDGLARHAAPWDGATPLAWDGNRYAKLFEPALRLVLIGEDAAAIAAAALGSELGAEVILITPNGPERPPIEGIGYHRTQAVEALAAIDLDRWTAVALLSHDRDDDETALAQALLSPAFYVGAIGARVRLESRCDRLRAHGVDETAIARLRAPIGLQGFGKAPRAIALSLIAEVMRDFHARSAAARPSASSISMIAPASLVSR